MNSIKEKISGLRTDYNLDIINIDDVKKDPLLMFSEWMKLAIEKNIPEPNAMNIATVSASGKPSSRIVLLRNFDEMGFVFYTNYESSKSLHLKINNHCALNFFWPELHKQIRIEGKTERVEDEISDAYFNTRPRESQIGAWASDQSRELLKRDELEQKFENLTKKFEGVSVPRPSNWGGYRIIPDYYEFWQGRTSRLHDRIRYELQSDNSWKIGLLNP